MLIHIKIPFIFIILFISLLSCQNIDKREGKPKLSTEQVEYNVDFGSEPYYYQQDGVGYLALARFKSGRKVSVMDVDGQLLFSFKLDSLMNKYNSRFISLAFVSKDTLALLTEYTNKIIYVDRNGTDIYIKDYSYLLLEGLNELYGKIIFHDGSVYTGLEYNDTINYTGSREQNMIQSNTLIHRASQVLKDTHPFSEDQPEILVDNFNNRFVADNHLTLEGNKFIINKDKIINLSGFSDTLYIYNLSGELMDTKKVQSIYYNSKINSVTIQAHIKDSELFISNTRKSGFILKLIWDPYRHIYYCLNRGHILLRS